MNSKSNIDSLCSVDLTSKFMTNHNSLSSSHMVLLRDTLREECVDSRPTLDLATEEDMKKESHSVQDQIRVQETRRVSEDVCVAHFTKGKEHGVGTCPVESCSSKQECSESLKVLMMI